MHIRSLLLFCVLALVFIFQVSKNYAAENITTEDINELFSEEEYPSDMDTLEEFIQSYYLLLESNAYLKQYKFLNLDKNQFLGDKKALKPFYKKLLELRNALRQTVTIYQIGDSHIQSGYFSGTARTSLQKYFGNAGRGLVFPLRLAGTNQPDDYKISASGSFSRLNSERGLSGYALKMADGLCLEITTNNFFRGDNSFNKLSLLTSLPGMEAKVEFASNETEKTAEKIGNYYYSSVSWRTEVSKVKLTLTGEPTALYGIYLEKEQPGLLYHSCGINGAGFYNLLEQ
ncbi:MAG TPA: hypothetical protein PLZ48_00910, partial [Candidatus Cloacimonas sp.]|nr:hypothetical protein [Candidatus Cloacimonas sp.]